MQAPEEVEYSAGVGFDLAPALVQLKAKDAVWECRRGGWSAASLRWRIGYMIKKIPSALATVFAYLASLRPCYGQGMPFQTKKRSDTYNKVDVPGDEQWRADSS